MTRYAHVALPIPKHTLFTYAIPDELLSQCQPGCLALLPMGRQTRTGVIWSVDEIPAWDKGEIRALLDILSDGPLFDAPLRSLLDWMARYYLHSIGSAIAVALPSHLRMERIRRAKRHPDLTLEAARALLPALSDSVRPLATAIIARAPGLAESTMAQRFGHAGLDRRLKNLVERGLILLEEQWRARCQEKNPPEETDEQDLVTTGPAATPKVSPPTLTAEQQLCVTSLFAAFPQAGEEHRFAPFLLEGVTGSGKTEVYFQAVERCLALGRQALLLVPEISLTPQLIHRCRARFSCPLAIFHSGLSSRARFDHWQALRSGQARLAIGARSALFAPFSNLGLVVVDEEHDASYKQEEGLPYQGRDMAVVRARLGEAVLILGSATPSLESMANAQAGRYTHLRLRERATGAPLPTITVVNLRERLADKKQVPWESLLSQPLQQAMQAVLQRGQQSLLFLNRRGYAPVLLCSRCGEAASCTNCSVALTYHKERRSLICHHCDLTRPAHDICPKCGQLSMIHFGPGTQQLERAVREMFPTARVARLDRDAVSGEGVDLAATLQAFTEGRLDILLGTQMVTKGHHFPNLALVGVVMAELSLLQPDFRAAERTFQQIAQVAGRAGRERQAEGEPPAQVLVQGFDPGHYAIQGAIRHDFAGFLQQEMAFRQQAGYPPFFRLGILRVSTLDRGAGEAFCQQLRSRMAPLPSTVYLGPAEAPLFKVRNRYRWQVLVKAPAQQSGLLHRSLSALLRCAEPLAPASMRLEVDVDPYAF